DFSFDHPEPNNGPFFQARILLREGTLRASREEQAWASQASGVRVFMEGFRVLPYGEPRNDWLSLDLDYSRRSRSLVLLDDDAMSKAWTADEREPDWPLSVLYNRSYFGAVFLTQARASSLKMLVNREGFVPDVAFD